MNTKKILLLIFLSLSNGIVYAQSNDSADVVKTTQTFLKAFVDFNWPAFSDFFSTDATIFFPAGETSKRISGKKEIEKAWLKEFPEFIDSTLKYELIIEPKDLLVQLYDNTAIVSFHLGKDLTIFSRRSLVLIRKKDGWKIVHLHASMFYKN